MAIYSENEVNGNEDNLLKTSSLNEEEIIVENVNDMNENLAIEKEIANNRRVQLDPDFMIMKNSGKSSVRDLCGEFAFGEEE